jgi:hypothetical protein
VLLQERESERERETEWGRRGGAVMVSNSRKRIQNENFKRFKDPPSRCVFASVFYCKCVVLYQGFNKPHFTPGLYTRLHDRGKSSTKTANILTTSVGSEKDV